MEKKIINNSIHNWINNNREKLREFSGKWIAHNENEVLASAEKGEDLMKILEKKKIENYIIARVHSSWYEGKLRILPIRFRTFQTKNWFPNYDVEIEIDGVSKKVEMLVDSGADISLIPLWLGKELGLEVTKGEDIEQANGIGGSVDFVIRRLNFVIDGKKLEKVPVALVLDEDCQDFILGREVVFDSFDIEFKQADEEIIFKYREN
jgi:predicted aspartyl protease